MSKEKVVLAYSGGLDTTAIIPWLKETYNYDVICCCVDCGQGEELDGLEERALYSGASKLYIEDITDDFCENYIMPCVQADAVYENKYLLGTSMARPGIAAKLVEIARKENAVAICHGATGKGNDQIRFELGIKALAPDLKIIAPWRDDKWQMDSRDAEIEYCKAHDIHLPFSVDNSYSRDRNLWHISHEGLELEDPACEPNYDHLLVLGVSPEKAPDEPEYLTMTFEAGVPKTINGEEMKVADIIRKLNELGGKHGIGIVDIVENRVVGMKSRGSVVVVAIFILFYNKIFAVTFDENFARATGTRANAYNLLIAVVIAVIIVLAMNLVGSLLISALVIFPALSAMRLFKSFRSVTISAAVLSVLSATAGILISILAGTPVGSTIVAVDIAVFLISYGIGRITGR